MTMIVSKDGTHYGAGNPQHPKMVPLDKPKEPPFRGSWNDAQYWAYRWQQIVNEMTTMPMSLAPDIIEVNG